MVVGGVVVDGGFGFVVDGGVAPSAPKAAFNASARVSLKTVLSP